LRKKHKITTFFLCLILVFTILFVNVKGAKNQRITDQIVFPQPVFIKKSNTVYISLSGTDSFVLKPGLPVLPMFTKTFAFPSGTKIKKIKCVADKIEKIKVDGEIENAQYPVIAGKIVEKKKTVSKNVFKEKKRLPFPSKWFEYYKGCGLEGLERKVFLSLRFYPVRELSDNIVEFVSGARVEIEYQLPGKSFSNGGYDLLIVSPSCFSDDLQPLVDHKNSMGVKTKLVSLEDIPHQGRDRAEDLKYYIKDAIDNFGIKFVLLVGSAKEMPVRYVYVNDDYETNFVSDLYFADIYDGNGNFSSWDTNNNSVFAEFNYNGNFDRMDLYPDVYLGRLACTNEEEVKEVVDKIINYENNKAYTQDWFSNIILCGGDTAPGDNDNIDEGEYANQAILKTMDGFMGLEIWASNGKVYYASNIASAFEEGAGFADFSGHGNPSVWATHPHNKENTWIPTGGYRVNNVNSLSNGEKLPIVVISACSCSKFDEKENCLGWSFVSNGNGGGIASLGNTGLGWIYTGRYVTYGLVGLMEQNSFQAYTFDHSRYFGELWGNALRRYINEKAGSNDTLDYKTIMEWQPFGDPTLSIRSSSQKPNKPLTPTGPDRIKIGKTYSYTTSTTDPDGDQIYYYFDWGDGTNTGWLGPYNNGETVTATHKWEKKGEYSIKVRAKDTHGVLSGWSNPLPIKASFLHHYLFFEKIYFIIERYLSR